MITDVKKFFFFFELQFIRNSRDIEGKRVRDKIEAKEEMEEIYV